MWPFKTESNQRAIGIVLSVLGLFLTAIGLSPPVMKILEFYLAGLGGVIFLIGLVYLIEVTFK